MNTFDSIETFDPNDFRTEALPPICKADGRKIWTVDGIDYAFRGCPTGTPGVLGFRCVLTDMDK